MIYGFLLNYISANVLLFPLLLFPLLTCKPITSGEYKSIVSAIFHFLIDQGCSSANWFTLKGSSLAGGAANGNVGEWSWWSCLTLNVIKFNVTADSVAPAIFGNKSELRKGHKKKKQKRRSQKKKYSKKNAKWIQTQIGNWNIAPIRSISRKLNNLGFMLLYEISSTYSKKRRKEKREAQIKMIEKKWTWIFYYLQKKIFLR